jgi:hypothetical protein
VNQTRRLNRERRRYTCVRPGPEMHVLKADLRTEKCSIKFDQMAWSCWLCKVRKLHLSLAKPTNWPFFSFKIIGSKIWGRGTLSGHARFWTWPLMPSVDANVQEKSEEKKTDFS